MNQPLYLEEARMWLTSHVHERRREMLLVAIGLVVTAVLATVIAIWYAGTTLCVVVIVAATIAYFVTGRLQTGEEAAIRGATIQKRQVDVPRMANPNMYSPHYILLSLRYVIALLAAPIALPVEAWKTMCRRSRLRALDEAVIAPVLAAITERNGAWRIDELVERFGEQPTSAALAEMRELEPVIWLNKPERVALTDGAKNAIREL